ncbi:MAG: succinyl-diaminopimelate desuccinylase [Alphaproteobacteria bacterium]
MIDVVDLTQNLICCASVTPEDAGAQAVLLEPLKSMGFEIFDLPFEGRGSYPVKNFFARLGAGTPHICYSGHTDVVPAGADTAWRYPPFEASIDNGVMYGRGTSDMKGANAAFVTAISKFLESHEDFKGSISVMITGDEEADAINGSQRILEWMKENNHIPDMCLVGESSNVKELGEEIKIGRRGAISGKLTVTGKQGHTAYQHLADNPLPRLAAMASALNDIEFDQGTEHFPPTNLELTTIDVGNKADNVIPAAGFLKFNVRFNTHWTTESLEQKIRDTLDTITKNYALEMEGNANPFITTPGPWTQNVFDIVKRHTNREPKLSTSGGTSDARFVAQYCPVVEFGLTNETIHQIDENLKIPDLHKLVEIYADIIENTIG